MTEPDDPRRASALDAAAGQAVRAARQAKGLSASALGRACGVTKQQVDKYEDGRNRMSVSRLNRIAEALGVDVIELMADIKRAHGEAPAPRPRSAKAAELMTIGMSLDEAMLDHLLAVARAINR